MTIGRCLISISLTISGVCFHYLRGLLQRTALEAISRLALTAANYREAVSILEERFGIKPQIFAKHMDVLIHVDAVSSPHNVKGLRHLYDLVESNVRSFRALGISFLRQPPCFRAHRQDSPRVATYCEQEDGQ